jgi:uncharacterized repeat protein (TIGR01451 family)
MTQQFEGGSLEYHLTGALAESVFEVHGAIYQKWAQKGFSQCPLGMPTSDVMSAQASGATGNAGWVSDFQGGHIYWLNGAPDAYAVHGPIDSLYALMGATGGWLGFPTSDEFLSQGNPRVNFEGGHITTTDGVNYQAFPAGEPPAGADLSVSVSDSPDPALLEENMTYGITVTNNGPLTATGVTLTDVLPSNVTFVSATTSQGTTTGTGTVTCNFGSLANGASATLTLVVKTKALGTITNTVTVRAIEYDAGATGGVPTGNNSHTEVTTVNPKTNLSITNVVSPDPSVIGQDVTYTLVAKNLGPSPATGVTVIDQLPSSVTFVSASSTVGTCSESSGTVTCNVGSLAKNATATITIVATTNVGGPISNTATVSGNEADLITSNNTVTRTSNVRTLSGLNFTPSSVTGCKDSVGKVTLTGSAPAGGVTVSLSSADPAVTVPATVTIPALSTNTTFTASTTAVAASQPVTVTATLGPATKSGTLTLKPIGVQSLTLDPNPALGGSNVTGTVQLECAAGPGDVTVSVTSTNNSVAQVPASVIVPAGATSQTFNITTGNVSTASSSTIRAAASGTNSSVVLQVQPGAATNQPPVVSAGADQTIILPSIANLSATVTDDNLPNPPGAFTVAWTQVSGPGTVTFGNANAQTTTASFTVAGGYVLRVTADDSALSAFDDVTITVNETATGSLSASIATPPSAVDLTAEGVTDWAHWGLTSATSFNHKTGVPQQISNFTKIGSGSISRVNASPVLMSWTDGTPTLNASNTPGGIFIRGVNNGFQVTAPADTTDKVLNLYVGLWKAQGRLEVTLSDNSASPYIDTTLDNDVGTSVRVYTISYRAGSAGQQLRIRWTMLTSYDSFGNITMQAATLTHGGGGPVNQAPVVNAGADQTITLPAGATLDGTVTDDGLPTPPASFTTTWSKFSGPGTVTFGDANMVDTTATFSQSGTYVLRLTADDSALSTSDDLTVIVNDNAGGLLAGSVAMPPSAVDLTAEGVTDWAHWGLTSATSFNHKTGVPQQISNFTKIGTGGVTRFPNDPSGYNWTDGTPTATATDTHTGVYRAGLNKGFQFTVPADTTERTLKVYVTVWGAQGKLEAILSDGSAAAFIDTSLAHTTGVNVAGVYNLTYRAASAGQTLTIRWTVASLTNTFGNVTLSAATLAQGGAGNGRASTALSRGPVGKLTFSAGLERGHTEQVRIGRTLIRRESGPGLLLTGRQRWTGTSQPARGLRRAGG